MNPPEKSAANIGSTIVVVLIFLSGVVIFGIAGWDWYKKTNPNAISSTPTPVITLQPINTPTVPISPTPTILNPKTKIYIQVQNGSGIPGVAAKVKELLLGSGYEDVDTTNAQAYEYDQTVVMTKQASQSLDSKIRAVLEPKFQLDPKTNILDEQNQYDVVIIVGKK